VLFEPAHRVARLEVVREDRDADVRVASPISCAAARLSLVWVGALSRSGTSR
jgi:hypothetical protein